MKHLIFIITTLFFAVNTYAQERTATEAISDLVGTFTIPEIAVIDDLIKEVKAQKGWNVKMCTRTTSSQYVSPNTTKLISTENSTIIFIVQQKEEKEESVILISENLKNVLLEEDLDRIINGIMKPLTEKKQFAKAAEEGVRALLDNGAFFKIDAFPNKEFKTGSTVYFKAGKGDLKIIPYKADKTAFTKTTWKCETMSSFFEINPSNTNEIFVKKGTPTFSKMGYEISAYSNASPNITIKIRIVIIKIEWLEKDEDKEKINVCGIDNQNNGVGIQKNIENAHKYYPSYQTTPTKGVSWQSFQNTQSGFIYYRLTPSDAQDLIDIKIVDGTKFKYEETTPNQINITSKIVELKMKVKSLSDVNAESELILKLNVKYTDLELERIKLISYKIYEPKLAVIVVKTTTSSDAFKAFALKVKEKFFSDGLKKTLDDVYKSSITSNFSVKSFDAETIPYDIISKGILTLAKGANENITKGEFETIRIQSMQREKEKENFHAYIFIVEKLNADHDDLRGINFYQGNILINWSFFQKKVNETTAFDYELMYRTIAHECGHCLFGLKHPYYEFCPKQQNGQNDKVCQNDLVHNFCINCMDYCDDISSIGTRRAFFKYQWDQMRSKGYFKLAYLKQEDLPVEQ